MWAVAGAAVLLPLSFFLSPSWFGSWSSELRLTRNMEPPIVRFGGFLVLLVLLRWRRPESWMLLVLACLPQSWGWYGTLPLFTIPTSVFEALFLAGAATFGSWIGAFIMPKPASAQQLYAWAGSLIVFTIYLPAVLLILRRPNVGDGPGWMRLRPCFGIHA